MKKLNIIHKLIGYILLLLTFVSPVFSAEFIQPLEPLEGLLGLPSITESTGWKGGHIGSRHCVLGVCLDTRLGGWVNFGFAIGGTLSDVKMTGDAVLTCDTIPGNGSLLFRGSAGTASFDLGAEDWAKYRITVFGETFEGDIPGFNTFKLGFLDEKDFTPFLSGSSVTLSDSLPTIKYTYPIGIADVADINVGGSLDTQLSCNISGKRLNSSAGLLSQQGSRTVKVSGNTFQLIDIYETFESNFDLAFTLDLVLGVSVSFLSHDFDIPVYQPHIKKRTQFQTDPKQSITFNIQTYTVSGYVRTPDGKGVARVAMNGLPNKPMTDSNGFYQAVIVSGWSGNVNPVISKYSFSPSSVQYVNVSSDMKDQNYVATPAGQQLLTVQKSGTGSGNGTVTGPGINCGSICSENLKSGATETLTATGDSGAVLTGWSGCDSTNGNTCTVSMNENKTVTATFTQYYTLSVQKAGNGSGTVTGTGINCGSICSENLIIGTTVTLTATWDSGTDFTGWSGCDSTNGNTCTVTMNQNRTVTATFALKQFTLSVQKAGSGSGTVTGPGINCGSICSENNLTYGTSMTLTATANSGSDFTGWSGCDSTNGDTCKVTMNQNKTVAAHFALQYTLSVQKAGSGSGTVTGTKINCGSTCSEELASGTTETLTATPDSGSGFTSWSGCDSTNGNTCTVTMNQNRTVTATFSTSTSTYTLAVKFSGTGGGVINGFVGTGITCWSSGCCNSICSNNFPNGTIVNLSAQHFVNPGSALTSWSGCDTAIGEYCTVVMNQNRTVTAAFTACAASTYTLTVNSVGPQNGGLPAGVVMGQTVTQGSGSGSQINCGTVSGVGNNCSENFTCGAEVTLGAAPMSGFIFTGWSGCDGPNGNHCTVNMNQNKTVTATFAAL